MSFINMLPGIGQITMGAYGLNHEQPNPADKAQEYLKQIPDALRPYFEHYINAGTGSMKDLQEQYGNMINNPGELYNKFSSGYTESPGYHRALTEALNAGNNAAAAGGMLGTPTHEEQNMGIASGFASKDFEDYINHIMNLYSGGLNTASNINQMGYNASSDYGNTIGNTLGQQAQYGYAGQAAQNQARQANMNNIFSGIGNLIPSVPGAPASTPG